MRTALKFEVSRGDEEQTSTEVIASVTIISISCSSNTGNMPVQETVSGGSTLVYVDGHFQQNWKTPKKPGSCYRVVVTTIDGGSITADFKLR